MQADGRTVGVLVVDACTREVDFPDEEVDLIARMADQAAVAIRQAQLHDQAQRQAERIAALHELTKEMTRTFDLDSIYERITESVSASDHQVALLEADTTHLRVLYTNARSEAERATKPWAFPRGTISAPLWGKMTDPDPLVVPDVRGTALEPLVAAAVRSVLTAAHAEEDATHLIVALTSERPDAFAPDDVAFVQGLVEAAALARRNARLYAEVSRPPSGMP